MAEKTDADDVLLSACMIMKDEAANIARCVSSLRGVVDEIVVYDTGSTDGSVELARSLGARVIEGSWHDDFAAARNAARAACRGRWLLHIDLDEEIEQPESARAIRSRLADDDAGDLVEIALYNLGGTELAPARLPTAHWLPRLVRRRAGRWDGAIHEVPVALSAHVTLRRSRSDALTLLHHGYIQEIFERRGKAERNRRIAEAQGDGVNPTRRAFEIARANVTARRIDDAIAAYETVIAQPDEPVLRRVAMEHAATLLLDLGRCAEAIHWVERRSAVPEVPGVARWLRARLALADERHEAALAELDGITAYTDHFSTKGPASVHMMRAQALAALDRYDEAGDELVAAVADDPLHEAAWASLLNDALRWPDAVAHAARLVPVDGLKLLASRLLHGRPDVAGAVAEHLWAAHPESPVVLAVAGRVAPSMALEDAARWAVRLRAAGLAARCPLRAIAADDGAPPMLRLQASYLGSELFGDHELAETYRQLTAVLAGA